MRSLQKRPWFVSSILYFFVMTSTLSLSNCGGGGDSGSAGSGSNTSGNLSSFETAVKDYNATHSESSIKSLIAECGFGYLDASGKQANQTAMFRASLTSYGIKAASAAGNKTISINDILGKLTFVAYDINGTTYTVPQLTIISGLNKAINDAYAQGFSKDTSLLYLLSMDPNSHSFPSTPRTLTSSSQINFIQTMALSIIMAEIVDVDLSNSNEYIYQMQNNKGRYAPKIDYNRDWLHKIIGFVSPRIAEAATLTNSHPSSQLARLAIVDLIAGGGGLVVGAVGVALAATGTAAIGAPLLLLAGAAYLATAAVAANSYSDAVSAAGQSGQVSDQVSVTLLNPSSNITVADTAFEVQFSVTGGSGIVNDRAWVMNANTGDSLTVRLNGDGTYKKKMPLTLGQNEIFVAVSGNSGAVVESARRIVTLNGTVGRMRVTLTWTGGAGTDVDLHVTDPKGEECYWDHANAARDGFRTQIGGQLDFDDRDGEGPENFTIDYPVAGNYLIEVNYYKSADVPINATVTVTLNEGSANESVTEYGPQMLTAADSGARTNTKAWWNVIALPVTGNIKLLPQITGAAVTHTYKKNTLAWTSTAQYVTKGYNVYGRQSYFWQLEGNVSNGLAPRTYSSWKKLNSSLLTTPTFDHVLTDEYNTYYEYYVLPVNVENVETQKNSTTKIALWNNTDQTKKVTLFSSLTLSTNVTGPFYVPSSRFPVEMNGEWKIASGSNPGPTLMISQDQQTWATLGSFDRGSALATDIYRYFDLEPYKGQYAYFKLDNKNGSFALANMIKWIMDNEADSVANTPPTANAGNDQTTKVGTTISLSGSLSTDSDGDSLSYSWSVTNAPAGSEATLSNPSSVSATFVPDKKGVYTIRLIVNDGKIDSLPADVTITVTNSAPVADAGPDQNVNAGTLVNLDGSGSTDVDGDTLTYSWTVQNRPSGSTTTITEGTKMNAIFSPDKAGTYTFRLTVSDGTDSSYDDVTFVVSALAAPTGVTATAETGQITLSWSAVTGTTSYNLYWSTSSNVSKASTKISNVTSPYIHTGRTNGTTYYYVVTSIANGIESAESTVVNATPISAPTGLTLTSGNSQITLNWTAVSGATSYNIYWSSITGVSKTSYTGKLSSTVNTYLHSSLTNGAAYYYVVTAVNSNGESTESAQSSSTPIASPTGLTASAGTSQVTLSWSSVTGAASYNIYWSTSSTVSKASTTISNVTSPYIYTGRTNGTTYYYVVTSIANGIESAESTVVNATPISAPTGLTLTSGNSQITLNWTAVSGATSYNIYWSSITGVSKTSYTGKLSSTVNTYLHSSLTNGAAYYYVVTAVNSNGESTESAQSSSTPIASPTGLTASAGTSQVTLSWSSVTGAASYNIYWSTSSTVSKASTKISNVTSPYVHTGRSHSITYYYVVTAVANGIESFESLQVNATPIAYTDNGDGTVKAIATGLVWQKRDNGTMYNWDDAKLYCGGLNLAGSGWRLPAIEELKTIIDTNYQPTIDPIFTNVKSEISYWSSTTSGYGTNTAWGVYFGYGSMPYYYKTDTNYVRCVR